jgi:hypothetical protein
MCPQVTNVGRARSSLERKIGVPMEALFGNGGRVMEYEDIDGLSQQAANGAQELFVGSPIGSLGIAHDAAQPQIFSPLSILTSRSRKLRPAQGHSRKSLVQSDHAASNPAILRCRSASSWRAGQGLM